MFSDPSLPVAEASSPVEVRLAGELTLSCPYCCVDNRFSTATPMMSLVKEQI